MATQRFDFDLNLAALPLAFDLDAVARLFAQDWPGAADGDQQVSITKCRLQDTKYQPAKRCVTTYIFQVEQPGVPSQQNIGVIEITPSGAAHCLYNDDPKLPWLADATDAERMRQRFAALLDDTTIGSCTITPVRYKPGARCVFRYELESSAGEQVFFGKLLADGDDQLVATVAALHEASLTQPAMPRILQPLAHWPDIHMLVQAAVAGGVELNALAFDPQEDSDTRERWIHLAGARLAGLHACISVDGPLRTITDDLKELQEYIAPITSVDPSLAARYGEALAGVTQAATARAESAPVASHGAFRTDQFMIEHGELVMIDLDGFCWANPARDLGNFLAYLRWKAIRQPHNAVFIERVGQSFLEGYRAEGSMLDDEWFQIYLAASILKIAGRRFRSLTAKEWHLIPQLLDAAEGSM